MTDVIRLFVAGSDALARPILARVELHDDAVEVHARAYVDPTVRSGRGGSAGVVTGLTSIRDAEAGEWLLATVERGRPRLIDPATLGVVALLGRRREWRGAAGVRSPFLPVIADRRPCEVLGHPFLLSHADGGIDLVRVCPGQPLERWSLGRFAHRVELLAGPSTLLLVDHDRVAIVDVAELSAGSCPLTDPRDVELALEWSSMPATVVAVIAVLERPTAIRVIERVGEHWQLAELELVPGKPADRRGRWPIARPHRWLSAGDSTWLNTGEGWSRIARNEGPGTGVAFDSSDASASLEVDADGYPWLWLWPNHANELTRIDGLSLAEPPRRWALSRGTAPIRAGELLVTKLGPAGDRRTIVHTDELAELLPFEPALELEWPTWFE